MPFVDKNQETVALPTGAFLVDGEGRALNEPVQISGHVLARQIHRQRSPEMHKPSINDIETWGREIDCRILQELLQGHSGVGLVRRFNRTDKDAV